MNTRLQEFIENYENGREYIYTTDDGELSLVVSRDSPPISKQANDYVSSEAPRERLRRGDGPFHIEPPTEMLFIELYKHGYDVARISELCGVSPDVVEAYFRGETYNITLADLAIAAYYSPVDEWENIVKRGGLASLQNSNK